MRQLTRHFLLWFGLMETFVFTGNILGWTALHYMLRKEGIYSNVCEVQSLMGNSSLASLYVNASQWKLSSVSYAETDTYYNMSEDPTIELKRQFQTCAEQDRLLNLAYTVGSFCMGSTAFIWGFLLDKWGLRVVRLIINALITSGCVLLSLTIKDTSFLLFPSLILMSLAGVPLRLANMQIADLFPSKRSTIITLYSGAFGASASVFVFIKYGFDYGLPWEWACFLLVALSVTMLPVTLFVLPADRIQEEKSGLFDVADKELSTVAPCVWGRFTYILDESIFQRGAPLKDKEPSSTTVEKMKEVEAEGKEGPFLSHFLCSVSFLLHQYWFSWILLYTIIYVGTLHLWLERISSDPGLDSYYSEFYGLFQVSGLFLAPIGGIFMDWSIRRVLKGDVSPQESMLRVIRSCFWPMIFTTFLEAIVQACKFFNTTTAITISIVAVSFLRAFFLSIGTAYLRIRFPAELFNKLLGIMSTVCSVGSLFQFPLFLWESASEENALYVNIFYSACLALAFVHPLLLVVTPLQRYFLRKESQKSETKGKS